MVSEVFKLRVSKFTVALTGNLYDFLCDVESRNAYEGAQSYSFVTVTTVVTVVKKLQ